MLHTSRYSILNNINITSLGFKFIFNEIFVLNPDKKNSLNEIELISSYEEGGYV